jgi:hypothetical protein
MKSKNTLSILALPILGCVAALLGGCAAVGAPGDTPSSIPPRIISGKDGRLWNNPAAFGKVPPGRQAEGDAVCQKADFDHATGFHPEALDFYGGKLKRGGFYCVGSKKDKNSSSSSGN